ncbi:MAG: hypothetical protein ABIO70_11770 [Pseudomonadota bacterium]
MPASQRLVVDTSVAVYLLLADPPRGQEERWEQARDLRRIEANRWSLCLAAPALGEVLAGVPKAKREQAADILCRMFEILDLDKDAALVVGDIALEGIRGRGATSRQAVKVDIEIVACAVRWKAGGVCFFDGDHDRIVKRAGLALVTGGPATFTPTQQPLFKDGGEG